MSVELEIIELEFVVAGTQRLGDVLAGRVLGDNGEDGMDHVVCL